MKLKRNHALIAFSIFLLILISVSLVQSAVLAGPPAGPTDTMVTANRLYESGDFAQAARLYQQLVDDGYTDSGVFYNLGNAYFKQGDLGRAVLSYRRAALLAPRDADIRANLALARSQTVDQLKDSQRPGIPAQLAALASRWLTLNELAGISLGLWSLGLLLLILYLNSRPNTQRREGLQYGLILLSLLFVATVLAFGSRLYLARHQPEAVVVASQIDVTSGPGNQYVVEFTLHGGTEVNLIETRDTWSRLALPGGDLQGWVPSSAVEAVDP